MIGTTILHYKILEKLGEGGMGVVYKAEDTKLERRVAIKFLPRQISSNEEERERFKIEAKAAAALNHPNIATIHAIEEQDDEMFIVMEYIKGQELRKIVETHDPASPLQITTIINYATQIAAGLQAAHEKNIVHRDIKSGNIMITDKDQVKIMDFGLAKVQGGTQITKVGTALGTAAYMSPEQARGEDVDQRTDIWSFGVVLCEMVTGRLPFPHKYEQALLFAILHDDPDIPDSVDPGLRMVLQKALSRDLDARYASVEQIIADLQASRAADPDAISVSAKKIDKPAISIAVLPFTNLSPDKENEYFSDGMTEELIDGLAKIKSLRVVARSSAFAFKGKEQDIREIGKRLNVSHVIEGSVRKAAGRFRITAQLIKVSDGYHLWSEKFDSKIKDVFEIQEQISENIVRELQIVLSKSEKMALQKVPTRNVDAYEYYLRGRQFIQRLTMRSNDYAQQLFTAATRIDPDYALAYAGIADCCTWRYQWWDRSEQNLREAEKASRKALELDPNLAEAHVAHGWAISLNHRYEEAAREFETAIRLDPKLFDAYYLYARSCFAEGDASKAAELFEKAHTVRPEDYQSASLLLLAYRKAGLDDKIPAAAQRTVEVTERHLQLNPDDTRALCLGAAAHIVLGDPEKGVQWAERALSMDPDGGSTLYNVACVFVEVGRIEDAIDIIEKAVKTRALHREWLENDPDMDPLRDHPRFRTLLERLK